MYSIDWNSFQENQIHNSNHSFKMTQLKTDEAKAPFYIVEDAHVEDAAAEKENQQ